MSKLIFLGILAFIYYKINQYYPFTFTTNLYFGGFIFVCLLLMYLMNYHSPFMFKMANNVQNANNIKLHELIPDYTTDKSSKNTNMKINLADKQLLRCPGCLNPIDIQYIDYYKLVYKTPIHLGGVNDVTNLNLVCPSCYSKMNLQ